MARLAKPLAVGAEVCKALGLNPQDVTKLVIDIGQTEVTVRTTSVLMDGDGISEVLREYELKPKGVSADE